MYATHGLGILLSIHTWKNTIRWLKRGQVNGTDSQCRRWLHMFCLQTSCCFSSINIPHISFFKGGQRDIIPNKGCCRIPRKALKSALKQLYTRCWLNSCCSKEDKAGTVCAFMIIAKYPEEAETKTEFIPITCFVCTSTLVWFQSGKSS